MKNLKARIDQLENALEQERQARLAQDQVLIGRLEALEKFKTELENRFKQASQRLTKTEDPQNS